MLLSVVTISNYIFTTALPNNPGVISTCKVLINSIIAPQVLKFSMMYNAEFKK